MNIFILDKNLRVCHVLDAKGDGNNSSPFYDDEYIQSLETGAETYTFKTFQNEYIVIGNYIAFMYNNECKLFQITEIEDSHGESFETKVYCEVAGLELTYEILRPREIPSANIRQYLENVLSDTDWEVGYVDDNIQWVHTINIENYSTVYSHIQETILKYECEIAFRVEKNGVRITHKYIDVYKQRGTKSKFRFDYDYNMSNVERIENSSELATALIGVGKDGLNFKTAEWKKSEGDPIDKPLGQDFVEDLDAYNNWNTNGKHLMGKHECDSESPEELLKLTYKALQERKNPKMKYSMDVNLLTDDEVFIGDEVYVIDNHFIPSLWLSARVNELTLSFTDKTKNKCTFSNYKEIKSKIKNDFSGILDQINNSMFMGISKGGFLNSNVEVNGFDIQIKNKLIDEKGKTYSFNIKNKNASDFLIDKSLSEASIMQSFAIDFINNHIYVAQLKGKAIDGDICLNKLDFNGNILGKMYLNGFGHGTQIGLENTDNKTYIWTECDGIADDTSNYGSKICRFEFINNTTHISHAGNVYNLVPEGSNLSVSVNQSINRLSVRYKYNNETYVNIYDLRSIVSNTPRLINKVCVPFSVERSSHQGHSISENAIYLFEGKSKVDSDVNDTMITTIDFKGNVLSDERVTHVIDLDFREAEGIFFRQVSYNQFELYFGFASGEVGNRKCNIYKYSDIVGNDYSRRGSFVHNNGHTCSISECDVVTGYDGSQRRKSYLLYVNELSRFVDYNNLNYFIIAEFKNGKWLHKGVEFEPNINDAIIGEIQESKNVINLNLYTNDYEAVRGQDGVDGSDVYYLELTNEFHSVPTDKNGNNGVYFGCETYINLYKGDMIVNSNVTYSVKSSENVVGNLVDNKYTVTNLTGDVGYVDLVANYSGNEYVKRFSLSKSKQGISGEDGVTPTVYWLMTSTSTISKDNKGNLKPSSITFWSKSKTGDDNVVNYQGIFKIYESEDRDKYVLKHTSELDDTVAYSPSSTAQSIKCELYLNDKVTLIDQDIINIVKDGLDGSSGADAKYVLLTGEQLFKYSDDFTGIPTPSTITLTGTPYNISSKNSRWYYKHSSNDSYTHILSNDNEMEYTINHNDSDLFSGENRVVTIKFDIDGYYDEMTIAKISDGTSGSDGYFVLLTNENHTVPCENNGDVLPGELEKAKTEVHVYKGTKEVDFTLSKVDSGCTSVYNPENKTLAITSLTKKSATVTMTITVDGVSFTKIMSISKAIKGDTGSGINIIGSLGSEDDLPSSGNIGDAYIINGFLYVWNIETKRWENVGQIKGDQGIPGSPGADGTTFYTWVKYADDELGNGISDDPIDSIGIYKKYMGIAYNKETQQESNNPKYYTWIKIVGEDGHDSIVANLTNDSHTIPTDKNGNNGNYSGCSTQIELFIGTEKITENVTYSFSPISGIVGEGNTSNGIYTVTNMTIDVGYVDLTARYNNKSFVKRFTISKNKQGENGSDAYTVNLTNENHSFGCDSNGYIEKPITTTTSVSAFKGTNQISVVIGDLPKIPGMSLSKSQNIITIEAVIGNSLADNGSFDIPVILEERSFIKSFSWVKVRRGVDGSIGSDGTDGKDAYTINITNDSHIFAAESDGKILRQQYTTTEIVAFKGVDTVPFTIGELPLVDGLGLAKDSTTVSITAFVGYDLEESGSFEIPIIIEGLTFKKVFSWSKAKKGVDGSLGDFPDTLPTTPTLEYKVYGFADIELSWTYENKMYYSYELYASKTRNFNPNSFDLIHAGQSSSFLFQARPNETWYFKVCAINSYGRRTAFSNQVEVTTRKISDLSNYVENASIGDALIGQLNLGRGWFGQLRGNYIDAKQLSVTDGNGKRTFDIDSFGRVALDVTSLKITNQSVATEEFVNNKSNNAYNNALNDSKGYTNNQISNVNSQISNVNSQVNSVKSEIGVMNGKIDLKVSKNDVVNQVNLSTEGVKIKANKIQLEGTTTLGEGGRKVKIENANYSVIDGTSEKAFFGFKNFENSYLVPKFYMGAYGFDPARHNYFGMTSYRGENDNPESSSYAYHDMSYRCVNSVFSDWSNIKMYSSGDIRLAPVKDLIITTNYLNGSYQNAEERKLASFNTANSSIFNSHLQIGCIRNMDNKNGLILADDSNSGNDGTRVRVHVDSSGNRFFRPVTNAGNIELGSGSFPWKTVFSKNAYSSEGVLVNTEAKVINNITIDNVLDNINFPNDNVKALNNEEGIKVDVTNLQGTKFIDVSDGYAYIDNNEMIKLLLKEVKELKEEIKILKGK